MIEILSCTYARILTIKDRLSKDMWYISDSCCYNIFLVDVDRVLIYSAVVKNGSADATDFEDNYKEDSLVCENGMEDAMAEDLTAP